MLPITTLPYPSSSPRPVPNVRRTNPWKSLKVLESPFTLIPASPLPMSVERTLESPWKSFYFNTSVSSPASMFCSSTTVPTCESACVYAIVIFRGSAWSSACDSWTYKLQSACENVQPAFAAVQWSTAPMSVIPRFRREPACGTTTWSACDGTACVLFHPEEKIIH